VQNNLGRTEFKGLGFYVPEKVLTNFEIEQMVDTSDEWIYTRTGIKQRHIAAADQATSDLAAVAARRALEKSRLLPTDLDLIIVATATPDTQMPACACLVQQKIGAKNAVAFDIAAACSGFIYGLSVADAYIKSKAYQNVLLIGAETFSRIINWHDRSTCILFGDGAGAALLQYGNGSSGIFNTFLGADGAGAELLTIPAGGSRLPADRESVEKSLHFLQMNGREVYKVAASGMAKAILSALDHAGFTLEDVDFIIPHQANVRIIESLIQKLKIAPEKVFLNLARYGNTSAASIPIALCEAVEDHKVNKGNLVVLVSFGAGLTWGASVIRW
jgi:3-oxoacyl-[acyl-carrier-protein] synthase III